MAGVGQDTLSFCGIPTLHGLIIAGRSDALAIGGPGHRRDPVGVPSIVSVKISCCGIPNLHRLIIAGRRDALAIGGVGDSRHAVVMATISEDSASNLEVKITI